MEPTEIVDAKHRVAMKRATGDVPDDGRYHVLVDGKIVFSTRVASAASLEYQEQREARMAPGREALRAESAVMDAARFRNEVLTEKASQKAKQGGRGKGGVGG